MTQSGGPRSATTARTPASSRSRSAAKAGVSSLPASGPGVRGRAEVERLGAGEGHDLDPELAAPLERPGVDRAVRVRGDPLGPERRVEQAGGGEHVH